MQPISITQDDETACDKHGDMTEIVGLIRRSTGHIHALKDPYHLFICHECSIETRRRLPISTLPGAPTIMDDPDESYMWVLFFFVRAKWDSLESAFVDLGPGEYVDPDESPQSIGYEVATGGRLVDTDGDGNSRWELADNTQTETDTDTETNVPPEFPDRLLRLDQLDTLSIENIPEWIDDYDSLTVVDSNHEPISPAQLRNCESE